jgi:hypothetical protein
MTHNYLFAALALFSIILQGCDGGPQAPDDRDKFLGTYAATDRCAFDTTAYTLIVEKVGSGNRIQFNGDGLYNIGYLIEAIVTGTKLVIPIQQVEISSTPHIYYEFTGQGALNGNELKLDYSVITVQDALVINQDSCQTTCLK